LPNRSLKKVLARLGDWASRRRRAILIVAAATLVAGGVFGHGLFERLGYSVLYDPAAESTRAADEANQIFGDSDPDVVAVWHLPDGLFPDEGFQSAEARAGLASTFARVGKDPLVARVVGESGPAAARFESRDRRGSFAVVSMRGTAQEKASAVPRLRALLALELPSGGAIKPELGGLVPTGHSLRHLAKQSLERGERIALPITGILLVVIFGSLVAALLPLAVGGAAIVLALWALDLLSHLIPVDAFTVNVVTILGLGVAIDYALFLISRYREELRRPHLADLDVCEQRRRALMRAVETAGRSVLFSGVTVAASLAGLFVFPQPFLRSIAAGGLIVTLLAATLALVVLPALIAQLGPRLLRSRHGARGTRAQESFWRRLATGVIHRRVAVCTVAAVALVLLGLPFRRLQPSRADVRALPSTEEPRRVVDELARDFPSASLTPISLTVSMDGDLTDGDRLGRLWDYTKELERLPGVARVESILYFADVHDRAEALALAPRLEQYETTGSAEARAGLGAILKDGHTLVRVISIAPPDSSLARQQVRELRALPPPPGTTVRIFGQAAALYDFSASLRTRAPFMVALVLLVMFVVLFIAFRSLILPIKAMVMTTLSLTASFGATVFIFQDGRFERLLGYQHLGSTDATLPVIMFAVVFGLSMDYEVLILNRVREAWLRTGRNRLAIVEGLTHTGRLVTGAAAIMVVVFSAFTAAPVVFLKALGMGMALAIALDATVVRMLLVPSTMALLGRLNWWAPGQHRAATAPR
jgi:RND superfamily putative drug exporter